MATLAEALSIAIQHHQAGRLSAAEQIYQQILSVDANHADALHLLGVAAYQSGKLEPAALSLRRALIVNPLYAEAHNNLGLVLRKQGKLEAAAASYRRALELKPDYAEAFNNLGILLKDQGKLDEAVACYLKALDLKANYAEAHNNLGNVFKVQGNLTGAVASYIRALAVKSNYAEAHNNLGAVQKESGKLDEAEASCRRALALKPNFAEALNNLGTILHGQGKVDEAIACYRKSLELNSCYSEALCNLGIVFQHQGKFDEATASFHHALALKPDFAPAYNNLGIVQQDQGILDDAIASYRRAVELKPDFAEAHKNLGGILTDQGKLDEAIACYRRADELKPDLAPALGSLIHQMQHACCWDNIEELSNRLVRMVGNDPANVEGPVAPFTFLSVPVPTTGEQQLQCARTWWDWQVRSVSGIGLDLNKPSLNTSLKSKIIIGYLSADFHAHATALLISELLEKHNRDRFKICGYSFGPDDGSTFRRRIVDSFERFVDIKTLSFERAAEQIAADGVDILVDLKGYTNGARTPILAFRPAPIQVNYLGYPGTMGTSLVDYILVDDYVVPTDQQPYYSEKLVHLPGCYQVNDSQREISSRTPSRAECNLPEDGFVFCCFNNSYKITPEMFGVWMELLKEVPGSVLWLLEGNRFAAKNLRREAETRSVSAVRLVFAPRQSSPEHLARHRLADLFLDTLPVNAHTTASDALWAGCPLLTISGKTFESRVAGSLLRGLDLPELITTSLGEYRAVALRLARDAAMLSDLRARLAANRQSSSLFDGGQFARNLETAFETMWKIHALGQKPRAFAIDVFN